MGKSMNKKLFIFIILYIILLLTISILGYIGDNSKEKIDFALKYFNQHDIDIGKAYSRMGLIPSTIYRIISILFLFFLTVKGIHIKLSKKLSKKNNYNFIHIFLSLFILFSLLAIIRLPFSIFTDFYRKELFGLMNSGLFIWLFRYLSMTIISIFFISVSISIMSILVLKTKRYIIHIPILFLIISLFFSVLFPRLIIPLFYDTVKLSKNELRIKTKRLLKDANINVKDIYVINKSKYSGVANAYMSGFGPDRKIYLYDTLLQKFSDDEILSIVGHELCHYIEEHMLIGIILGSFSIILVLLLLEKLSNYLIMKNLKFLVQPEGHPTLLILMIMIIFVSNPIQNSISRYMERRADIYSINISQQPDIFIKMKTNMAKNNKSHLGVHPVYSWYYHSHPSTLERIKIADH